MLEAEGAILRRRWIKLDRFAQTHYVRGGYGRDDGDSQRAFPHQHPDEQEEYYYRTIFEEHFPSRAAAQTVPSVPSVACSTAEALAWDASFKNHNDPSGRAVKNVHNQSY